MISGGGRLGEPVRRRGPDTLLDALPFERPEDMVEPPIETVWRIGENALLDARFGPVAFVGDACGDLLCTDTDREASGT